jgi:hypothetical protein
MHASAVRVGSSVVPATAELDLIRLLVRTADDVGLDVVGIQDHPYQARFLDTWSLIPTLLAHGWRYEPAPDAVTGNYQLGRSSRPRCGRHPSRRRDSCIPDWYGHVGCVAQRLALRARQDGLAIFGGCLSGERSGSLSAARWRAGRAADSGAGKRDDAVDEGAKANCCRGEGELGLVGS